MSARHDRAATLPRSNPFSTRFVRPGALPYRFAPGTSAAALVARLAAAGWRGQIVGPHGSGKSTLLASLAAPLAEAGRPLFVVALHDGARRMPAGWMRRARAAGAGIVAIDGYEQLGAIGRVSARVRCALCGWGLLVTAHRDAGLPTIHATGAHLETAQAVAAGLQSDHELRLEPEAVAACFAAAGGDFRETLFALYDRWETESRALRRPSRPRVH